MGKKKAATKKAESAKKADKPRQQFISKDVEPERFKDVEDAAESYVEVRDKRIALLAQEKEAKEILTGCMKAHKLEEYKCVDTKMEVTLTETVENVKVKVLKDEADD